MAGGRAVALGAVATAAVIAAVVAAVVAFRKSDDAERARDAVAAQEFAAASLVANERAPERALLYALTAYERDDSYAARNALLTAWERDVRLRSVFGHYSNQAMDLAYSPDGRLLAVAAAPDGGRTTISLFDVRQRRVVRTIKTEFTSTIWFSRDGRTLMSASDYARLFAWDVKSGALRHKPLTIEPFFGRWGDDPGGTWVSDDGSAIVTAGPHGALDVWNTKGHALLVQSVDNPGSFVRPLLSPDGRYFALVDHGVLSVWDVRRHRRLRGAPAGAWAVAFTHDSRTLALTTRHRIVRWDLARNREVLPRLATGRIPEKVVAFSPDGHWLLSGGDRGARMWNLERPAPRPWPFRAVGRLYGADFSPDSRVVVVRTSTGWAFYDATTRLPLENQIAIPPPVAADGGTTWTFAPDGRTVASAADDGVVRLWSIAHDLPFEASVVQHPVPADCCEMAWTLAFTPDGQSLLSGRDTGGMVLWNLRDGSGRRLRGDGSHVAVSADGRMAAGIGFDSGLELWDLVHRKRLRAPRDPTPGYDPMSAAFDPRGHVLAVSSGTAAWLWRVPDNVLVGRITGVGASIAWSPDGKLLVSGGVGPGGGDGQRLTVTDVASRKQITPTFSTEETIWDLAFSPAGDGFATGGTNGIVHIWKRDGPSWTHSLPLTGHEGYVNGVGFSPDGRTLVSAGDDGTIALWDVAHEGPLGDRLAAPDGVIEGLAVSARGAIATSHYTGIIRTWSSLLLERDPHVWQRIICRVVGRSLTRAEWDAAAPALPYSQTCGA